MATPASQKTSPSPPLPSSSHITLDAPTPSHKRALPDAQSDPSPDLDAFLRRAHYGKLARELRARLSYASFKTSNNVSQVPLPTLEQQYAAKLRPSPSAIQQQQQQQQALSPRHRLTHAEMMPPPASPRNQSLYSALLGSAPMPPTKRAKHAPSPNRATHQRSHSSPFLDPNGGGRSIHSLRAGGGGLQNSEPDDLSAAATLTALLLNRPNSRSEGSSLSRSSSSASVTVYTQSQPSSQMSQGASLYGSQTTVMAGPSGVARPKTPQPDDKQAAELMLFLATSPSPARSTHSRTRSESRPGQLLSKARVLFGSNDSSSGIPPPRGTPATSETGGRLGPALLSASSSSPNLLLPPPPSPQPNKHAFDPSQYINTSPFPSPVSTGFTPKPSIRGEGRRLFGDDDSAPGIPSGSGSGSSAGSRNRPQSGGMYPSGGGSGSANAASVQGDKLMLGMPSTSVLGPAMGANA